MKLEFEDRDISVSVISPDPMDTGLFYPAKCADALAYHKTVAALSNSLRLA